MQIEGDVTMGLGYALSEALRFRSGEIVDRNVVSPEIPKCSSATRVDADLVENNELAPHSGGEPAIRTTGDSLGNTMFDAAGVRKLLLPMLPERNRQAIAGKRSA